MNISYFYFVLSYLILSGGRAAIIILHYITNHTKVPKRSNSILANLVKFGLVTFALSDGFLPANLYLSNPPIPGPTKQYVDLKMHQKKLSIILYQQKFCQDFEKSVSLWSSSIYSPIRTFFALDHKIIRVVWHLTLAKPGTCITKAMRDRQQ